MARRLCISHDLLQQWLANLAEVDRVTNKRRRLAKTVTIRGEPHSVPLAIQRSLTHTSYHVGQIMLFARLVHIGDWKRLRRRPGGSQQHNQDTWGTSASRGASGIDEEL